MSDCMRNVRESAMEEALDAQTKRLEALYREGIAAKVPGVLLDALADVMMAHARMLDIHWEAKKGHR